MKVFFSVFAVLIVAFLVINSKGQLHAGSSYQDVAGQAAARYGIDARIFARQIQQESGYNPSALSPAGAQGIAQLMPGTASRLGVNPWDPASALDGAARLDASLLAYYHRYDMMLAAYNAGASTPHGVDQALARCGAYWFSCMPAETRAYVHAILG